VARDVAPEVPRGFLFEAIPDDWHERCRRLGTVSLHAEAGALDRSIIQAVRAAGLRLVTYTVNDPVRAATLFAWGVDCVITDRPDIVRPPPSILK
jgi:glycerophosphoryl diester phosphodiesterase